ncbi:hypothetical protein EYF80_026198 [Liparis tanakae]|uniref:Uncharacterized protein n=1 Tax=Liparis tanakae TaxID=230148 RepID=A0A4Z2HCR2_9TELE|nr:hypothetical protein EYF80_026198 [Liparis tanakae]
MDGSLKSHSRKVVSLDEVTTSRWVGSTIPGSGHHLSASHQPIGCDYYTLVALQGCRSNPDSGDLARALCVHLPFLSVRRVLVVITWSLWVGKKEKKGSTQVQSKHTGACRNTG